jgi:hypothetical protein
MTIIGKGGLLNTGPPRESPKVCHVDDEDIYYTLTLDPTIKDHRIIALIIDYTSEEGDCSFYRPGNQRKQCRIAPRFKVIWNDCGGKCFVNGLTCPVILDYVENIGESEMSNKNLEEATGNANNPSRSVRRGDGPSQKGILRTFRAYNK